MMRTRLLFIILTMAALTAATAHAAVTAGAMSIEPSGESLWQAKTALDPELLQSAQLVVNIGKERRPATLQSGSLSGGKVAYQAAPGLEVTAGIAPEGRCLVWTVACTNTGNEALWLEVGPQLQLKPAGEVSFFDGWDDFASPSKLQASTKLQGNMSLTSVSTEQATLAVGLEPSQLVSYLRHEYEPQGETARLAAITRVIVDPGKTENLRFISLAAPGEWGKYEALDAYYESFPSFFVPHPDVDPRVNMGSAQYVGWPAGPWSPEIARRLYGGWDWCYAPFHRTGDIVGRPELWDYTPARPFDKSKGRPREEFLEWRKQAIIDGERRCNIAMMFYIPSQVWCEEQLAKEKYADSLTQDPKAVTYFDKPWVTGHDNELRVFPYMTSFGEQTFKDMAQVAQDLEITGFAFDTAGDGVRYFGPVLPRLPHRAWDDEVGAYCDELVAIANLMDYVHTLKRDGRPLGVVSNPMANGTYSSCFHSDSAMLERNPWSYNRTESDRLRWKMGHKTIVWWESWNVEDFVDPDSVTGDQLRQVYQGLADFTLLQSLRNGYIPTPMYTSGMAKLTRWLPAIVECVQTGWQPVPAARVPEPLWASRYGKGLDSLIAIAHETGEPVQADVEIVNMRLGNGTYLFSGYDGSELQNNVEQGQTRLALEVPVRTPVLLRAQASVSPATALQEANVAYQGGICFGQLNMTLSGRGAATISVRIPEGMRPSGASADGKDVTVTPEGQIKLTLRPNTKLSVSFASKTFWLTDRALLEFPFIKDGQANCTIVIPQKSPRGQEQAALRLRAYFSYWTGRVQQPADEVVLPIEETPVEGLPQVSLIIRPQAAPQVSRVDDHLQIAAPDDKALLALTLDVLRALDSKYWFPERVRGSALNTRTGLSNTIIE